MTRKTFAIFGAAGLLALAGLAAGLRPNNGPAANAAEQVAGASVETTVQRRTRYVRVKNKPEHVGSASGNGGGGGGGIASRQGGQTQQGNTPRPTTSASGTGDDDHGSESKRDDDHGSEAGDHDEADEHHGGHHDDGKDD
jgi:hypothetical protein